MKKIMWIVSVIMLLGMNSFANWKTERWKYSASDLSDSNCLQNAVDDLDARLDSIGASDTNGSLTNIVLNAPVVKAGTLTNNVQLTYVTIKGSSCVATGAVFNANTYNGGTFTNSPAINGANIQNPNFVVDGATNYTGSITWTNGVGGTNVLTVKRGVITGITQTGNY